jgi:glutathione S-transferase
MITLYHAPMSRSSAVLFMLHELGEPFEVKIVDIRKGEQKAPAYCRLNPMGKVPALTDDDVLVTEMPAILVYLADKYAHAGLAPAIDAPDRGTYLKWMFFNGSCLEPAFMDRFLERDSPPSTAGWGNFDDVIKTLSTGLKPGPWLLDDRFSAADVLIGSALLNMQRFNLLPELPEFLSYVQRISARPTQHRALAEDMARMEG